MWNFERALKQLGSCHSRDAVDQSLQRHSWKQCWPNLHKNAFHLVLRLKHYQGCTCNNRFAVLKPSWHVFPDQAITFYQSKTRTHEYFQLIYQIISFDQNSNLAASSSSRVFFILSTALKYSATSKQPSPLFSTFSRAAGPRIKYWITSFFSVRKYKVMKMSR